MATKKEAIAKQKMQVNGKNRKTLDGCGRKPLAPEMEETLFQCIIDRRSNKLRVSRIMILYDEMLDHKASKFEATRGWLEKFIKATNISSPKGSRSVDQQNCVLFDPSPTATAKVQICSKQYLRNGRNACVGRYGGNDNS